MTNPTTFLQQTYQDLARLKQQAGQYDRPEAVPPALRRRIEALEDAIYLTRQCLDGALSERNWLRAIRPLLAESTGPTGPEPPPTPPTSEEVFPPMPHYNLANIRSLLTKGFSDSELRTFCFDTPEFRDVYDQLSQTTGKEQIISLILEHADQNLLFEPLLVWAKAHNLNRYEQHQPYTGEFPRPQMRPHPAQPGGGSTFIIQGDFNMGDNITIGDITNSNVNIKSKLNNVSQSIGALPRGDDDLKAQLQALIQQLSAELQKAPAEQAEDAEAVAEAAKDLVEKATAEKPNKKLLSINGENLKQAAQSLAGVMPIVLDIATRIVTTILKL